MNRGTGDRLVGLSVRGLRVNRGTGDRLVGLSVRGVKVNSHLSLVLRLRASGVATALTCIGGPLPYISCQNSTSGDGKRAVIDICGCVQFVMDRNNER